MTMMHDNTRRLYIEAGYDEFTGAVKAMTADHSYIHDGLLFETFHKASVASSGVMNVSILTPAAGYIHLRPSAVSTSGDLVTIAFYEGTTMTVGTGLTAYNHNRNSTKAPTVVVKHTPTITADGTLLGQSFIGGGTGVGGSRSGGERGEVNEWVLKPSTQYLLRITNGSSAANVIQANVLWYEESRG
jgi:hypothetical protein